MKNIIFFNSIRHFNHRKYMGGYFCVYSPVPRKLQQVFMGRIGNIHWRNSIGRYAVGKTALYISKLGGENEVL